MATFASHTAFALDPSFKGEVLIDGSSTVFPITAAVVTEFQRKYPKIKVSVGISGTGGGFKRFVIGETDINEASRPIKPEEALLAKNVSIKYTQFPVAYDGITIVVNRKNTWVTDLTVAELKKIWEPGSQIKTWKDIRPEWPAQNIALFGPGKDSGTFDYFTHEIIGQEQASRSDYSKSEDDNVLVKGVMGAPQALSYFGFAYYLEHKDKIRAVPIKKSESGPAVEPTVQSILDGSYAPLSRPLFLYVTDKSVRRPEVCEFVRFYLENVVNMVKNVGYVPMPSENYEAAVETFNKLVAKKN